jgi:hypothetical protein
MIIFENEGLLELDCIRTMGINVKKDDTAIGHFGTGLKYAIAVLLRTGHQVEIFIDGEHYKFTTKTKAVRGKDFEFIMMNDEQLAFTTEYGKNWEVWMAFRELACNATDEDGDFASCEDHVVLLDKEDFSGKTVVLITGQPIEEAYAMKDEIFFDNTDSHQSKRLECINQPSQYIFYRGVRILEINTTMTYNILEKITLTEDRTAANSYEIEKIVARYFLEEAPQELITNALLADTESYERKKLSYNQSFCDTSENFTNAAGALYEQGAKFSASAKTRYMKAMNIEEGHTLLQMTDVQKKQLEKAIFFLGTFEDEIEKYKIVCCESLGQGILGKADEKKAIMYLSKQVFDQGTKQVAATLLEEFYHLDKGFYDETREFQTYLFDRILTLAENVNGEPI